MSEHTFFKPTREHEWLHRTVGQWTVDCAYHTIPGDDPIEVKGKEVGEMLGDFWVVSRFEADMMGTPIVGQAVTRYDPVKQVFVGTWKDNYTPFHYTFEGTLSDDENELILTGENFDPMRQRRSIYRSCTEWLDDNERVLSLSVSVGDDEVPILEYRYKRK